VVPRACHPLPYTTLFRSQEAFGGGAVIVVQAGEGTGDGGGIPQRQLPGRPALGDLAEAVALAGEGEAFFGAGVAHPQAVTQPRLDRKSTRLNSSHVKISY